MKVRKIKYLYILAIVFLFSCTIEKRLYMDGYYISSARTLKDKTPEQPPSPLISERFAAAARDVTFPEEERMYQPIEPEVPAIKVPVTRPAVIQPTSKPDKAFEKMGTSDVPAYSPDEGEGIKDDVKKLLIAALGALALAVIYCIGTAAGIAFLSKLLFILIPFSIIGVWIFALMLRTKYSYEDPVRSEKQSEKKKIYSKKKAFLLAGFLGIFGAHRFYLGYTDVGIFQLFTFGGFFVYYFIDMLMIKNGKLKPKNGDYGVEDPNYKQNRKKSAPNSSQKFIKIALLISLLALVTMLGSAIFLKTPVE